MSEKVAFLASSLVIPRMNLRGMTKGLGESESSPKQSLRQHRRYLCARFVCYLCARQHLALDHDTLAPACANPCFVD